MKSLSEAVLASYWTDLLIQFEKSESDECLKKLLQVEQELKRRSEEKCYSHR
jgi:hypothetical protein